MLNYDVLVLATNKSLTHTQARINATLHGARIATMPSVTEEIINRCLDVDYLKLRQNSENIYNLFKESQMVRITTKLGTSISFTVGNSKFFGRNGGILNYSGAYGNLPEGEVSFSPSSSEGTYVVDVSFPNLGILNSPLIFRVKGGIVCDIQGEQSLVVKKRLSQAGKNAYKVAELGIGLNPKAKFSGNVLEDEKVIGSVHIATGNNLSYGGTNNIQLHLDGVISQPSIYVDRHKIMDNGIFCDSLIV